MIGRYLACAAFAVVATVLGAGCSTATEEEIGNTESAATPSEPSGNWALAQTCSRLFKRHDAVRSIDIEQGAIRWGCGDVPGVTDPDLGQEYCEYQAVQNGKIVRKAADLTTGDVACVFTSVFTGAGEAPTLKTAMADSANLGVAAQTDAIVQMQKGFNNRGAATALISDCARAPSASALQARERLTACYQAFAAGGANSAALEAKCKSGTVSDATWAEVQQLGAKVLSSSEAGYESQQDIVGCMGVRGAGVSWRNSDPMICARAQRSATECSCKFNAVPNTLKGIPFTGWVGDHIPQGCRFAKVNGADYPFVAICPVTDQEVSDIPLNPKYVNSIGNFCHDRFGVDLVMKLPLRPLQTSGTCNTTAGYCSEYMGEPGAPVGPTEPTDPTDGTTNRGTDLTNPAPNSVDQP